MQACTEGQKRGDETFLIRGELTQHRNTQTPTQPSILLENVLHCWFFSILPGLGRNNVPLSAAIQASALPNGCGADAERHSDQRAEGHTGRGNVLLPAPQNHSGPEPFAQMGEQ